MSRPSRSRRAIPTGAATYADLAASDTIKVGAPGGGTEERLALEAGVPRDRVIVVPDTQSGIKMLADGRIDVYALPYLSLADADRKGRRRRPGNRRPDQEHADLLRRHGLPKGDGRAARCL